MHPGQFLKQFFSWSDAKALAWNPTENRQTDVNQQVSATACTTIILLEIIESSSLCKLTPFSEDTEGRKNHGYDPGWCQAYIQTEIKRENSKCYILPRMNLQMSLAVRAIVQERELRKKQRKEKRQQTEGFKRFTSRFFFTRQHFPLKDYAFHLLLRLLSISSRWLRLPQYLLLSLLLRRRGDMDRERDRVHFFVVLSSSLSDNRSFHALHRPSSSSSSSSSRFSCFLFFFFRLPKSSHSSSSSSRRDWRYSITSSRSKYPPPAPSRRSCWCSRPGCGAEHWLQAVRRAQLMLPHLHFQEIVSLSPSLPSIWNLYLQIAFPVISRKKTLYIAKETEREGKG